LNIVNTAKHTNPKFKKFLSGTGKIKEPKPDLATLLILPTERVPRYKLLLQRLLDITLDTHPDYNFILDVMIDLKDIDAAVKECRINSIVVPSELSKIHDLPPDFPGSKCRKSGNIHYITLKFVRPVCLFLFDNLLVYAYPIGDSVKYKGSIYLGTTWIRDLPDTK